MSNHAEIIAAVKVALFTVDSPCIYFDRGACRICIDKTIDGYELSICVPGKLSTDRGRWNHLFEGIPFERLNNNLKTLLSIADERTTELEAANAGNHSD